ncbi:gp53-like domain-containing protein [Burkholderia stagnalis]|uniref:gp53-like domain-containing protein n=1 Tax=Burkholderia stagnalis TaxID=1503054 RepID=UPI0016241E40|nr:hypothetical protein [Burkholderia stagnalis]
MANQPEQDQWDAGVYQIEKTDPVLGGLGGITNAPLVNLTNRTKYLYSRIQEILGVAKGYAIAGGTANAITCSYTPAVSAIADGQVFKGKVATANTGATTFTPNPAAQGGIASLPVYGLDLQPLSGSEIVGQFAVRYNASLNSGGGAFVLVENPGGIVRAIAPALADSSGAVAPTSWIRSLFAPLASPAFTGSPQASTPPQFDSSTKLATTAFVRQALGNMSSASGLSGTTTLTAADSGAFRYFSGSSAYNVTMPSTSAVPDGTMIGIGCNNTAGITLVPQGADKFFPLSGALLSSFGMGYGENVFLVRQGGSWIVAFGTASNWLSNGFFSSLGGSGYQKLPSGLIIQWTQVAPTSTNTQTAYNFPIAFPTGCLGMSVSSINNGNSYVGCQGVATSRSAYTVMTQVANTTVQIIAVGY